ncbi:MAG: hypothetical protein SWY16_25940, partial [Cyanobacteriota bacterium]|nr:hypothetical protein [Cyanobacteriota bacterium]
FDPFGTASPPWQSDRRSHLSHRMAIGLSILSEIQAVTDAIDSSRGQAIVLHPWQMQSPYPRTTRHRGKV